MENKSTPLLSVGDFIALTNQTLEYAFQAVLVEGEVSGFKVNQNKYVFFDLKDEEGSIGCFMTVWQLRHPIEDGMKITVVATPKLTNWGKFSLTVSSVQLSGAGSIKKSFELLKDKLTKEGLFDADRKRLLPEIPTRVAVISSTQAAGYADFIKIVNDRWGGLEIVVAHTQVQGKDAPDQMIRALRYLNSHDDLPEVIVLIRGGGSLDDLSAFNDELLVREIATSRVPTLVGVGHETDTSLADLAADVRAVTPSNAAQLLVPDRSGIINRMDEKMKTTSFGILQKTDNERDHITQQLSSTLGQLTNRYQQSYDQLDYKKQVLAELDPHKVLARGYAIVRGITRPGEIVDIELKSTIVTAEVQHVTAKK